MQVPPYIKYKGKSFLQQWMEGAPSNMFFFMSKSGWIGRGQFQEWFGKVFMPAVKGLLATELVLLLLDGHGSHYSLLML